MAEDVKTTDNQAGGTTPEPTPAPEPTAKTYLEEEYKALETQLENLKKSTADNEDFKKKFEESEQARKDFEYKTKVGTFVKSLGLTDDIYEKYVTDIIVEKGLKFEGEKLIGGDDVVSVFKEKYPNAFKSADTSDFTRPTGNSGGNGLSGVEQAFYSINPNLKP